MTTAATRARSEQERLDSSRFCATSSPDARRNETMTSAPSSASSATSGGRVESRGAIRPASAASTAAGAGQVVVPRTSPTGADGLTAIDKTTQLIMAITTDSTRS